MVNKQTTRGIALGLLIAVMIILVYKFTFLEKESSELPEGFMSVSIQEYENLKNQSTELQSKVEELLKQMKDLEKMKLQEEKSDEIIFYELTISNGMTSLDVSNLLEEIGIIQNSVEFNQYLGELNLQTRLQLGTYLLSSEMSYEEIAHMITNQ